VYDLAVTNPDARRPTAFTLTDTLAFGANITVNSATVTAVGNAPTASSSWNGSTDTTVVANGPLGPGATVHYTVTVHSTVLTAASAADRLCADGGGFRNRAGVVLPEAITAADQGAEACADPASPTITKKVVSVAAGATTGQWIVTYDVTVTNGSLTQLSYSLHDQLGFPAGVTITSTAGSQVRSALDGSGASAPKDITGWTGTGSGTALASDQPIAPQSKHAYSVGVGVTIPASLPAEVLACSAAGTGHGYFNSAALASGMDRFNAEACAAVTATPPAPVAPPPPVTPPTIPVTG
jgi:hypothetical protein